MAPTVVAIAAAFTACATTPLTRREASPTAKALERLGQPEWSVPAAECPVDVFPNVEEAVKYLGSECAPDLDACLTRCQGRDANACYAAALRIQELKAPEQYSEALFMRACRLGIVSGCTNRAAGIVHSQLENAEAWRCGNRTFEAMCERNDPWACTMWGSSLLQGRWVKRDISGALKVLPKGCLLSERDPACVRARELMDKIAAAGATSL
jgi:hypothetical protein